ncbi:MAG: hypothetical protein MUQ32_00685 [Chloroflexi bacterium]|nr:hypothetical protein [Chloroflexota bacterium]
MGNEDLGHSALPKLFGAPAYARPPVVPAKPVERPFDPDDLPIEAELTGEELDLVGQLTGRPYQGAAASEPEPAPRKGTPMLRGRPFRIKVPLGRPKDGGGTASGG